MAPVGFPERRILPGRAEGRIVDDPLSGRTPHVGYQQVGMAVRIVIQPGGAHAGPEIHHARFFGHIPEVTAVIAIQILAPEIISDIQIRPAIAVVVAPGSRKAEPVIVVVHPAGGRYVFKVRRVVIQVIAEQKVGRPVARVVIWDRITILCFVLEEEVTAKIQVQATVPVVVRRGYAGEPSLRRRGEAECVRNLCKPAFAIVQEKQWLVISHQHQVLMPRIPQVHEECRGGIVQNVKAGSLGDVAKLALAAVLIQPVG